MTNEQKAKEIASSLWKGDEMNGGLIRGISEMAAMKMAEWKEQQMIEKVVNWLRQNTITAKNSNCQYTASSFNITKEEFISMFKKAMEEE